MTLESEHKKGRTLPQQIDCVREKWKRKFYALLNTTLATLGSITIESIPPLPEAASLGDPQPG